MARKRSLSDALPVLYFSPRYLGRLTPDLTSVNATRFKIENGVLACQFYSLLRVFQKASVFAVFPETP